MQLRHVPTLPNIKYAVTSRPFLKCGLSLVAQFFFFFFFFFKAKKNDSKLLTNWKTWPKCIFLTWSQLCSVWNMELYLWMNKIQDRTQSWRSLLFKVFYCVCHIFSCIFWQACKLIKKLEKKISKPERIKSLNFAESNMHRKTNVRGSFETLKFIFCGLICLITSFFTISWLTPCSSFLFIMSNPLPSLSRVGVFCVNIGQRYMQVETEAEAEAEVLPEEVITSWIYGISTTLVLKHSMIWSTFTNYYIFSPAS